MGRIPGREAAYIVQRRGILTGHTTDTDDLAIPGIITMTTLTITDHITHGESMILAISKTQS